MKKLISLIVAAFMFASTTNAQVQNEAYITKEEPLPSSSLTCSPNPVHEQLTIQFDNYCENSLKWLITDFTGRIILNGTYPACQQMIQIDAGIFQNGIYLFVLTTRNDSDRKIIRFVKN